MLTWLEVDLGAIRNNIKQIKKYIGPDVSVAAVVKSNAYGHGLVEVARAAAETGVEFLCVDNVAEARQLVNSKQLAINRRRLKILILGGMENEDLVWVIKNGIRFGIFNPGFTTKIERSSQNAGVGAKVHIKIDTGMHRLGLDEREAVESIKIINNKYKNIEIEGIWSHFADSGSAQNKKYTQAQIDKFKRILEQFNEAEAKIKYQHLCNSAGALDLPQARYNLVRCGIIIYGVFPSDYLKNKFQKKLNLRPALSFMTKIVSLKKLKRGERIGYGLTYRLKKNSTIAVLAVGYKDGYGRDLSNKGEVIIKNKRCSVVGRICMRMTMVDVSKAKNVKLGEEAVLIGGKGHVRIEADEVAEKMDTIPYEILTRIAESVPRIYKNKFKIQKSKCKMKIQN